MKNKVIETLIAALLIVTFIIFICNFDTISKPSFSKVYDKGEFDMQTRYKHYVTYECDAGLCSCIVKSPNPKFDTEQKLTELIEYIQMKNNYKTVIIINIIPLEKISQHE